MYKSSCHIIKKHKTLRFFVIKSNPNDITIEICDFGDNRNIVNKVQLSATI